MTNLAVSLALVFIDRVRSLLARKVPLKECSREAHGNPYIDNCDSSRWELVGERKRKSDTPKCDTGDIKAYTHTYEE